MNGTLAYTVKFGEKTAQYPQNAEVEFCEGGGSPQRHSDSDSFAGWECREVHIHVPT
jgi:hypothetical protein